MQVPEYTFDERRLSALAAAGILDTAAEPGFDDIVELAAQLCQAPVALVSFVAGDRQWFKARLGFQPGETGLNSSVCAHALVEPDLLIIPDLTADPRTAENPLVASDPHIRFYAGAPLRTADGHVLGSLCVIDREIRPGGLTEAQKGGLRNLARQVIAQLELRRALVERDALLGDLRAAAVRRTALLLLGDRLRHARTLSEMARIASATIGDTLQPVRAGFGRLEDGDETIDIETDWTAAGAASVVGRHRFKDYGDALRHGLQLGEPVIVDDVLTDTRTAGNLDALLGLGVRTMANVPVRHDGRTVGVLFVHGAEAKTWGDEALVFIRNVADRLAAGMARLAAEAQQNVLNQELSHRLKNTFAMVQAIAAQTLRSVAEQEVVGEFMRRLHALSAAHDVLVAQSWASARLGAVVDAVLVILTTPERFEVTGPNVNLGPRAALSLSMLLHELATNALKHGALSRDEGRVRISWRVADVEPEPELILDWVETGGPAAREPERRGFGSRLIRMGLVGTGGVELRFHMSGFNAEFRAPLSQVQLS